MEEDDPNFETGWSVPGLVILLLVLLDLLVLFLEWEEDEAEPSGYSMAANCSDVVVEVMLADIYKTVVTCLTGWS